MAYVAQALTYASVASNLLGTTTASFTPNQNDTIVVATVCENASPTITAPTSSGLTFTSQVSDVTASTCKTQLWTAPISTAALAVSRTVTMGAVTGVAAWHSSVCWVVTNGILAGSPATVDTRGAGAPTATLTTAGAGSLILWSNGDFAAVSPATAAYRSSAVQDFLHDKSGTTNYVAYYAHQTCGPAGAQTVGLSLPAGQTYKVVGIEIQDIPHGGTRVVNRAALIRASTF